MSLGNCTIIAADCSALAPEGAAAARAFQAVCVKLFLPSKASVNLDNPAAISTKTKEGVLSLVSCRRTAVIGVKTHLHLHESCTVIGANTTLYLHARNIVIRPSPLPCKQAVQPHLWPSPLPWVCKQALQPHLWTDKAFCCVLLY